MKQTEVLTVEAERPRMGPRRRARIAAAVVLTGALLAAAFLVVNRHDQPQPLTEPSSSAGPSPGPSSGHPSVAAAAGAGTEALAGQPPGLLINGVDGGSVLDRRDRTAASAPWAVVVRGPGGSLGH